jgi:prepilin-type N-terminal cleavage/methylation domain-containing protein
MRRRRERTDATAAGRIARGRPAPPGFTLVEIAVALLVVSVGIMAIIGLFPVGLESAKRIKDEAMILQFKDFVFATVRELSTDADPVSAASWNVVESPATYQWGANPALWKDADRLCLRPNAGLQTNTYVHAGSGMESHALRYDLVVSNCTFFAALGNGRRGKAVHLRVWPGEFGPTNDVSAYIFYTEVYYYGM